MEVSPSDFSWKTWTSKNTAAITQMYFFFPFQMSQNGEDVSMKEETLTAEEETQAQVLLDHGISKIVAKELLAIYETGKN